MLSILAPKMARSQNSGSALKIALQFCTMKEAKRDMEIILMVFLKKSYLEQLGHFGHFHFYSVKVSRLKFVSLPIAEQLQPNFYKLLWRITN